MDFLLQMVNDQRLHQDEILLLALLQSVKPETVSLSIGEVPIAEAVEELRQRVERNIERHMQATMEAEANAALGKPDVWSLLFGGGS
jgi:hypothetical protein